MYNRLFSRILDSSIWLEPDTTRIVWFTLLAAMDEDGFAPFAAVGNLANRARVPLEATVTAITTLESPDPNSSNQAHEGRRIERVPGGWIVINKPDFDNLAMRADERSQTRERVRRHRELKRSVTPCNGESVTVTNCNEKVTPSDTDLDLNTETDPDLQNVDLATSQISSHARSSSRARAQDEDLPPVWKTPEKNPHARNGNLINGSELRRHAQHAWCSPREGLCITEFLHREFLGKSAKTEPELKAWYQATIARFDGLAIGDDTIVFWRNEFAVWLGTVTARPTQPGRGDQTKQAMQRVVARRQARREG